MSGPLFSKKQMFVPAGPHMVPYCNCINAWCVVIALIHDVMVPSFYSSGRVDDHVDIFSKHICTGAY